MFDDQQLKNGCQCQLRYTLLMLRSEHNIQGGCTSYINNWLMLLWIWYVMQCIGLRIQACVKLINTHVVLHGRPWLALILSGSTQNTLWRLWKHLKEFYYAIKKDNQCWRSLNTAEASKPKSPANLSCCFYLPMTLAAAGFNKVRKVFV